MTKATSTLFFLGVFGLLQAHSQAAESADKPTTAVLAWFKMNPAEFGCYLQKTFGVRDKKWNCDIKEFKAGGDPCKNTAAYYVGPKFPKKLIKKLSARLSGLQMSWEHGALQNISLDFDSKVAEADARRLFGLPATGAPAEFSYIEMQDCSKDHSCLIIEKFEHMGAGEADCGGEGTGD
jgi:hypothetical protein